MTTTTLTIEPLIVPVALDAPDGADFRAYGQLNRQICDEMVDLPDIAPDAAQLLASWQDSPTPCRPDSWPGTATRSWG